jgi:hypothetical protein
MIKTESLIYLVNSMTKAERKAFYQETESSADSNYSKLYSIIANNNECTPEILQASYLKLSDGASFDSSVNYLYKLLLETMLKLKKAQDNYFLLFDKILKARLLFEKSLYKECFRLLDKAQKEAVVNENSFALLIASRVELEYLLFLNYPDITEKQLLKKQFNLNETLKLTQKIHQQSALYELLRHRMIYQGNARSEEEKSRLNDLVVSEMSIVNSSNFENFEINKLHQLFQAYYLICVGDYKSALHSFKELIELFNSNKHLWTNPPIFYLLTIEGVLDSLRGLKNYNAMDSFIGELKSLKTSSTSFNINIYCLVFLYELFAHLDVGDFKTCETLMKTEATPLFKKINLLSLTRNAELSLYSALVYFGLRKFKKARSILSKIIFTTRDYTFLPLYRTMRLVNLMILYELKDYDAIKYESRSIKRAIQKNDKGHRIEKKIISFVNKKNLPYSKPKREQLWSSYKNEFQHYHNDVYEQQILKLFDFSAWIESKIRRVNLAEVLKKNVKLH